MADEEYVSFDNALRELQLTSEQLKRLVSEGEIRAIRGEHNSMRFRKEEIERLKQDTGKTIQFTEASSETLTDDLLFDESDELDLSDEGASTVQLTGSDTFVAGDKPAAPKGKAAPPPAKGPARPAAKPGAKPAPASATPAASVTRTTRTTSTTTVRRTTGRATVAGGQADPSGIGAGVVAGLILTSLVLVFCSFIVMDISNDGVSGVTEGLALWAAGK